MKRPLSTDGSISPDDPRVPLSRLMIEWVRIAGPALFQERLASMPNLCETLLVYSAVMIGHAEGRPMSATKIGHFLGIPRPTVIRRLAELSTSGFVERRKRTYRVAPGSIRPRPAANRIAGLVVETAQQIAALRQSGA